MSTTENFVNALSEALQKAAGFQAGSAWNLRSMASDEHANGAAGGNAAFANVLHLQGALNGDLYICPDEAASRAAFAATGSGIPEDLPSAWSVLLQSLSGEIARSLTERCGAVQVGSCSIGKIREDLNYLGALRCGGGETPSGIISVSCDSTLSSSIEASGNMIAGADALSVRDMSANAESSFERVIDVPLAVTIRFGKRQLTVRELLELNMGSLVELDRQVEEPVDLMLGERLIARGEVVIVDGNYGMRVTEVVEQPSRRSMGIR